MAENKKFVIEAPDWVYSIVLVGRDNNKRRAEWYWTTNFSEIDEYTDSTYQKGLEEGKKIGEQEGLDKAWAAARKICLEKEDGGMPVNELMSIFNADRGYTVLKEHSASEVIDSLELADSAIVEGDEVKVCLTGSPYLVTNADSVLGYSGVNTAGRVFLQPRKDIVKTGRHFDSVDAYLKG